MADRNATPNKPIALGLEALESREVPASFGTIRGLSIAHADIMPGDGQNEYITGTGPGRPALVRIWNAQGDLMFKLSPFGSFSNGVYLATGDIDNDGNIELLCSTAPGTTGQVKIYAFRNGGMQNLGTIIPYGPAYSNGVQIATGDVTGDRKREIIIGRENGSPTVQVWSYDSTVGQAFMIRQFQAYGSAYHGGVTVASANVDITFNSPSNPYNFNYDEIITGRTSQLPQVHIFDIQTPTPVMRASYMAYDTNFAFNRTGINVAAGSTDGRRGAEIYVGLRNSATIRIFNGWNGAFLKQIRPYPPTYSHVVNFCVNTGDDNFADIYTVGQLITVAGDGPFQQIPIIWPGQANSPAGLNGSFPAA